MKLRRMFAATTLSSIAWVACQKEASVAGNSNSQLVIGKTEVKKGETVQVALRTSNNGQVAKWTVTPSAGVEIDSAYSREGVEIQFSEPGEYSVQGEVRNVGVNCLPTPGWDTCYKAAPVTSVVSGSIKVTN